MSGQSPPEPVKIPAGAADYTAATVDPELRSTLNALLLQEGHVKRIQERLLHSLNADPANWPTNLENHALSLLRSGEAASFPALLRRVIEDVRRDTEARRSESSGDGGEANGAAGGEKANGEKKGVNGSEKRGDLAVPRGVVEEALKATRECLEDVAYLEG